MYCHITFHTAAQELFHVFSNILTALDSAPLERIARLKFIIFAHFFLYLSF